MTRPEITRTIRAQARAVRTCTEAIEALREVAAELAHDEPFAGLLTGTADELEATVAALRRAP